MTCSVSPDIITIPHGPDDIQRLLIELFVEPRRSIYRWSAITNQTAQVRLAYPGQHLASVLTGVPGKGTAARGDDLVDGSEVKTCSRADQLGECRDCGGKVLASANECPACRSTSLHRKTDSHWILSIKTDDELDLLLYDVPRVVLILFDRPVEDPGSIQVRVWEIWPRHPRHAYFSEFMKDYYENNYKVKRVKGLDPAPCNLHPLKFDFYMMNPVPIFHALISHLEDVGSIEILERADPTVDRCDLPSEDMPPEVCSNVELLNALKGAADDALRSVLASGVTLDDLKRAISMEQARAAKKMISVLSEPLRMNLSMREKHIKLTPSDYRRR